MKTQTKREIMYVLAMCMVMVACILMVAYLTNIATPHIWHCNIIINKTFYTFWYNGTVASQGVAFTNNLHIINLTQAEISNSSSAMLLGISLGECQ